MFYKLGSLNSAPLQAMLVQRKDLWYYT